MLLLESYIKQTADCQPEKIALVCGDFSMTYRELWQAVEERSILLRHSSGRTTILRTTQSADFLITYFASHLAGKVVVPLAQDLPDEDYQRVESELNAMELPSNTSEILYTTGTTGRVKGTMISHESIIANAENLVDAHQYTSELAFVVCGPLNHIGSLSKVWPTMMVGGTIIITSGMKDLEEFFGALDYPCRKIATFLVPASIRMLLQFSKKRLATYANKIDFIETGAAAISQADMDELCQILPQSRLYNTYASTETGIICTHDFNSDCCVAGCLGKPMKHAAIRISEDGRISTSGKTTMLGYAGDEQATLSVLKEGRCHTQDYGYLDAEGRLHLKGRNSDIINVGGYKVNPVEVENAAMSHPDVSDCICIADSHPVLGTALRLLVVTTNDIPLNKKSIALFLKERLENYKVPQMYSKVESIARTFNGKLDRKHYQKT